VEAAVDWSQFNIQKAEGYIQFRKRCAKRVWCASWNFLWGMQVWKSQRFK